MKEKLRELLESEGLKPGQFAEIVGINPAGVSHLLAGRNKPGFELLQKILRRFPRVSPDWLLMDEGPMYRTDERSATSEPTPVAEAPIRTLGATSLFDAPTDTPIQTPTTEPRREFPTMRPHADRQVARVVIFYADQTFESFTPSEHN